MKTHVDCVREKVKKTKAPAETEFLKRSHPCNMFCTKGKQIASTEVEKVTRTRILLYPDWILILCIIITKLSLKIVLL